MDLGPVESESKITCFGIHELNKAQTSTFEASREALMSQSVSEGVWGLNTTSLATLHAARPPPRHFYFINQTAKLHTSESNHTLRSTTLLQQLFRLQAAACRESSPIATALGDLSSSSLSSRSGVCGLHRDWPPIYYDPCKTHTGSHGHSRLGMELDTCHKTCCWKVYSVYLLHY